MIEYTLGNTLVDCLKAKVLLNGLDNYYPDFEHWYVNKCMPDIILGDNTLILAKDQDRVIGLGICKKEELETKLRCVRVIPEYINKGIGIHIVDKALRLMDSDKPYCTVCEEMIHSFSRAFINRFNFSLDEVNKGMYRKGKLEYIFNKR